MPEWIHERAKHILAKNPSMPEGMAFGIATQQSHALGKSPKGYGTHEGRRTAKRKFKKPKKMERMANPGELKTPKLAEALAKFAFVEALPVITGLASGYGPGRDIAGETAKETAPRGRAHRSSYIARNAAAIGVPLGGLAAMALAHKYRVAPRMADFAAKHFPEGLISEPDSERELIRQLLPGAAAIGGSLMGGAATGAAIGGLQRLRGPFVKEKTSALKPSPMWSRIGGAASKKPVWMAQSGFTPTGFKTPAQRLSKSMDMGTFDSAKGLKPLDLGKMQQAAQQSAEGMKMGSVMLAITKTATGQQIPVRSEKEDAETGDEADPIRDKESSVKQADDGGVNGGFSTNQYSGVMNPPTLPYRSGIPPWQEPPVKTVTPQAQPDYTKEGGLLGEAEELAAQEHGQPSGIRIPSSVAGLADDAFVLSRRFTGRGGDEETTKKAGLTDLIMGLSAPPDYVKEVADTAGIPEEHARSYVYNIRPQRFGVSASDFARDVKPVWHIKENLYNPLQQGLASTAEGSPEEAAYLKKHQAMLDKHYQDWMYGQADLRKKYTGGDTIGPWAQIEQNRGAPGKLKTSAGITPAGRLNSAKAIGAPKMTSAPGPSISQIAKPKGFGTPMSGAKKGNHII